MERSGIPGFSKVKRLGNPAQPGICSKYFLLYQERHYHYDRRGLQLSPSKRKNGLAGFQLAAGAFFGGAVHILRISLMYIVKIEYQNGFAADFSNLLGVIPQSALAFAVYAVLPPTLFARISSEFK